MREIENILQTNVAHEESKQLFPRIDQSSQRKTSSQPYVISSLGTKVYSSVRDTSKNDLQLFLNTTLSAAGVPVFELIRKMEEENSLTRVDRAALHEALYNPERREIIIKAFRDVELGMNPRLALNKLKFLIYDSNDDDPSSVKGGPSKYLADNFLIAQANVRVQITELTESNLKAHNNSEVTVTNRKSDIYQSIGKADHQPTSNRGVGVNIAGSKLFDNTSKVQPINENEVSNTESHITKVVGDTPVYSGEGGPNVCTKILTNFTTFQLKHPNSTSRWGRKQFAVIVGSGSFNPITRMHLRTFYVAKQCLEKNNDMIVLGSLISPAHSTVVRERYRTAPTEILPSPHRLAVAQVAVEESKWLSVDPWEITRRRGMDYLSLLEHVTELLKKNFADIDGEIRVLYLCKANAVPRISSQALRRNNYGVVCVCRPPESDQLIENLGSRWKGLLYVAEDDAIVDASMGTVSSRRVRDRLKAGEPVEQLVGDAVAAYFKSHHIGAKMAGTVEWEENEKKLPTIASKSPINKQDLSLAAGDKCSAVDKGVPVSGGLLPAISGANSGQEKSSKVTRQVVGVLKRTNSGC